MKECQIQILKQPSLSLPTGPIDGIGNNSAQTQILFRDIRGRYWQIPYPRPTAAAKILSPPGIYP